MPTYEVTSPDGRAIEITGPTPPTQRELERIFSSVYLKDVVTKQADVAAGRASERSKPARSIIPAAEELASGGTSALESVGLSSPTARGLTKGVLAAGPDIARTLFPQLASGLPGAAMRLAEEAAEPTSGEEAGQLAGRIGTNVIATSPGFGLGSGATGVFPMLARGTKIGATATLGGMVGSDVGGRVAGTPGAVAGGLIGGIAGGKLGSGRASVPDIAEAVPGKVGYLARLYKLFSPKKAEPTVPDPGTREWLIQEFMAGRARFGPRSPLGEMTRAEAEVWAGRALQAERQGLTGMQARPRRTDTAPTMRPTGKPAREGAPPVQETTSRSGAASRGGDLFDEAARFVRREGQATSGMLQRRFSIGFSKATDLLDRLERGGIVGPATGDAPRVVNPSLSPPLAKAALPEPAPSVPAAPGKAMEEMFGRAAAATRRGESPKPSIMDLFRTERSPKGRLVLPERPGLTPVERSGISSKGFRSYGYDPEQRVMEVERPDGSLYRIHGVTPKEAAAVEGAKSRGAAILALERKYPSTREGTAPPSIEAKFAEVEAGAKPGPPLLKSLSRRRPRPKGPAPAEGGEQVDLEAQLRASIEAAKKNRPLAKITPEQAAKPGAQVVGAGKELIPPEKALSASAAEGLFAAPRKSPLVEDVTVPRPKWNESPVEAVYKVPWRQGGEYQAPGASYGQTPPKKLLASFTDPVGYTVRIVGGVKKGQETAMGVRRYGTIRIYDPAGNNVRSGYFMGWPEPHWNMSLKHYNRLPWERKALLEVMEQATRYKSLREQFENLAPPSYRRLGTFVGEWERTEADRFSNMLNIALNRIRPRLKFVFGETKPTRVRIGKNGSTVPHYDRRSDTIVFSPKSIREGTPEYVADTLLHELAHQKATHDFGTSLPGKESFGPATLFTQRGKQIIAEPMTEHTDVNLPKRRGLSATESAFMNAFEALKNDPIVQKTIRELIANLRRSGLSKGGQIVPGQA